MSKPEFLLIMEDHLKEEGWIVKWGHLYGDLCLLLERFRYYGCFIVQKDQDIMIARALRYYDDTGEQWKPVGKPTVTNITDPESINIINTALANMKREEPHVKYTTDPVSGHTVEDS
jgi:hypothetical protein